MEKYLLGADLGSGSVKLTLLGRDGRVAATCSQEYPTFYPKVGFAEQDPGDWCGAFRLALKKLFADSGIQAEEIAAIAPDAATHTAVLLGEDLAPLARAILWTDQRSAGEAAWLKEKYGELIFQKTLHSPTPVWTLPQLIWVRDHSPEIFKKTRHILFAKDYLRLQLTGKVATDPIDAMGSMLFDAQEQAWSGELCGLCGVPQNVLPPLLAPESFAGEVTREAAASFGLKEGTPVLTGATDTALEQLAAGSVLPGHSLVKLATAGRICVIADKARPSPFLFNYRHVVPDLWYPGTGTASCAASYRWFRDNLGGAAYDELNAESMKLPPGSEGLMFHPYLQGELTPYNDSALRGSFTGISSRHTRAHFARAVLEGVAYSLRDCLDTLAGQGLYLSRTRIIGGGASSPLWRQIVADVLAIPLEKAEVDDSSFGAAMLAGVGIGWFQGYREAAERCVRVSGVTIPDAAAHAVYEKQFLTYKRIHDALAPVYHTASPTT